MDRQTDRQMDRQITQIRQTRLKLLPTAYADGKNITKHTDIPHLIPVIYGEFMLQIQIHVIMIL